MGRRPYGAEKWRKEQARKAKRDAKLERRQQTKDGEPGGGPPIDWDAMVGGGPEGQAAPEPSPAEPGEPPASDAEPEGPRNGRG
jgi:hypothetical protein